MNIIKLYLLPIVTLFAVSCGSAYAQKRASEYYKEAVEAAANREHLKAIELYSAVMSLEPTNDAPVYSRGYSKMQIGDIEGAIVDFSMAIELNPANKEAYYNLGVVEYSRGDIQRAISYFMTSLEMDANNTPAMLQIARISYEQQDIESALTYFEMCIKNDRVLKILTRSELHYAYKYFASSQSIVGNYESALSNINFALAYDNTLYDTYHIRGAINIELGHYEQAVADLSEALRLNPNFGYGYFARAMAYRKLGDTLKANRDFETAKQYGFIAQ